MVNIGSIIRTIEGVSSEKLKKLIDDYERREPKTELARVTHLLSLNAMNERLWQASHKKTGAINDR